nr:MAG TPA_asm: hypothetical protein [Caudoviricetes sp.]
MWYVNCLILLLKFSCSFVFYINYVVCKGISRVQKFKVRI